MMATSILILMGGRSRRMGELKAILTVREKPMLAHALDAARQVGVDDIIVVLGPQHRAVTAVVDTSGARVVVNTDPDRGMGSSLALGLASMRRDVDCALVMLGDQPNVDAALLNRLLDLHAASGKAAAAVSCAGVLMPPVVLCGSFLKAGLHVSGDHGLRDTLRGRRDSVAVLPVDRSVVEDIDTPEDLKRAQRAQVRPPYDDR